MNRFEPKPRFGKRRVPVCRTGSLWPALEIGRTRFPALQYRISNAGRTPDRSLSLKQSGFMRLQGKRSSCLAKGRIGNRYTHDGAGPQAWPSPFPLAAGTDSETSRLGATAAAARRACQGGPLGLWERWNRRTGRGPAMTSVSLVPFGSNEGKPRRRLVARPASCKPRPKNR